MTRDSANYTDFRDRSPDLYCQRNSIALKRFEFQNLYKCNNLGG